MSSCPNCEEKFTNMASSSTGYYYSDDVSPTNPNNIQRHLVNIIHNNNNQIQQSFEFNKKPVEIYNSTAGMEMIEFPPKYLQQSDHQSSSAIWKGVFRGGGGGKPNNHPRPHHFIGPLPSSSKTINDSNEFYDHQQDGFSISDTDSAAACHENRFQMVVDDPSLRRVFRCEGNERPSHGLSLSLSATNHSAISLQSFELRQQDDDKLRFPPHTSSSRDGLLGKSINIQQYQQMVQDDHWHLGKDANLQYYRGQLVQIKNSQYLWPAQELLNEFCSLVAKKIEHNKPKTKARKTGQQCLGDNASSSSSKQPLHSLELLELQKKIAKLFQMLDEVDRGYKHYCDKMKVVVSSFEEVAGNGAATVYSLLASKAMSKHFRCLRNGITDQIKSIKKAMGEKDSAAAPGASLGETPRLRILDQTLRQRKPFQQINMLESHPWRPQRGLPERSVSILRAWLFEHFLHPYPTDVDKHILARHTGLSRSQVSNWFINARVRLWKPMVEEMYLEETKEEEQQENNMNMSFTDEPTATATSAVLHYDDHGIDDGTHNKHQNQNTHRQIDQKPTAEQLILRRINEGSLSSIVNNNPEKNNQHTSTIGGLDSFGAPVDLDFSTDNIHHHPHKAGDGVGIGGGSAVSLTLGLQQNGGNGLILAFSPTSQQASLFYHRDQMEDCQSIQYSIVDGEGHSLPYRNLMGAQLLHDFAG